MAAMARRRVNILMVRWEAWALEEVWINKTIRHITDRRRVEHHQLNQHNKSINNNSMLRTHTKCQEGASVICRPASAQFLNKLCKNFSLLR